MTFLTFLNIWIRSLFSEFLEYSCYYEVWDSYLQIKYFENQAVKSKIGNSKDFLIASKLLFG